MRYDLIDLQGDFKINGSTGFQGAALGYSSSTIEWLEVNKELVVGSLGATGYNYAIVAATGSPTENSLCLTNAINQAATYWYGGQTIDNRYTIFLLPGEYRGAITPLEHMDIVGLARNPYDVVLSSNFDRVLISTNASYGLRNVYLSDKGQFGGAFCTGDAEVYWKNIVVGTGVISSVNWINFQGTFEDIFIEADGSFAVSDGNILGTFSNITGNRISQIFTGGANINISLKNLEVTGLSLESLTSLNNDLRGNYEDIKVITDHDLFKASVLISGNFKNIKVFGGQASDYLMLATNIEGRFENIWASDFTNLFRTQSTNSQRLLIKNSHFENIINFLSVSQYQNLILKNISTNNVQYVISSSGIDASSVEIKNSTFLNCSQFLMSSGDVFATFSHVTVQSDRAFIGSNLTLNIEDCDFTFSENAASISTEFSMNLRIRNTNIEKGGDIFEGGRGDVDLDISNSTIGDVNNLLNYTYGGNLYGTFSNCVFRSVNDAFSPQTFYANIYNCQFGKIRGNFIIPGVFGLTFDGKLTKVDIGSVAGDLFAVDNISQNTKVREITVGNVGGNAFCVGVSNAGISPQFEKITLGNVSGDLFCSSGGPIAGNYLKIKAGKVSGNLFRSDFDVVTDTIVIRGNFRDIEVESALDVFKTYSVGSLQTRIDDAYFENIIIGSCSTIFDSNVYDSVKIRNLKTNAAWNNKIFRGSLENSTIDQRQKGGTASIHADAVIKRSNIYRKTGEPFTPTTKVYLSKFNLIIGTPSGFTNSNFNIANINLE